MEGLSIIIPCYNEASRKDFKKRILHFQKICNELTFPCEIIYIDDGSKDNTYEILKKENQRVYSLLKNEGKYAAIEYGISFCKYDTILMIDADIEISFKNLVFTYNHSNSYPVIIGSRVYKNTNRSLFRKFLSACSHFISKNIFELPYKDTQCGFKMFKKDIYEKMRKPMLCKRYLWDMEFLFKLKRLKVPIMEFRMQNQSLNKSTFKSLPMLFGSIKELFILLRKGI